MGERRKRIDPGDVNCGYDMKKRKVGVGFKEGKDPAVESCLSFNPLNIYLAIFCM